MNENDPEFISPADFNKLVRTALDNGNHEFQYGAVNPVTLSAYFHVYKCSSCDESYTDEEAEHAKMAANSAA